MVLAMRLAGPRLISTILVINHGDSVALTSGRLYAGFEQLAKAPFSLFT